MPSAAKQQFLQDSFELFPPPPTVLPVEHLLFSHLWVLIAASLGRICP